jgi:hypothetical protein
MKSGFLKILHTIRKSFLKEVSISMIVCDCNEVSIKEGWGGKHIKYFPPYDFYRIYTLGEKNKAKKAMEQWYYNRFVKDNLCVVSKKHGGMLNGSLFKVVSEIHSSKGINLRADLSNAQDALITQAIRLRVEDRFKLMESIIEYGYQDTRGYVILIKAGNHYTIVDGHHRTAAAAVCGYSSIPFTTMNNILLRLILRPTEYFNK